jgi:dolichyl-phosphate-mannose-protein mannosyltransferase
MNTQEVAAIATPSSVVPPPPAPPVVPPVEQQQQQQQEQQYQQQQQQQPIEARNDDVMSEQAVMSAPPEDLPKDLPVLSKEERIEYRDENGRILDEEEVAELAGKVSFKTRYETRTRIVDAQGNEIYEGLVDGQRGEDEAGVAPPHPDVEGQNPETQQDSEPAAVSDVPPSVEVEEDQEKEKSVEQETQEAKPASEAQAATAQ